MCNCGNHSTGTHSLIVELNIRAADVVATAVVMKDTLRLIVVCGEEEVTVNRPPR